jgi:hypothetical protein
MKKIVLYLFAFLCGVILSACGGGGGSSSPTPTPTPTPVTVTTPSIGVFVDSAIENIKYRTKTLNGYTNAQGEFKFLPGESVIFSIGSIDLPEVTASEIITPLDLAKKSTNRENVLDNLLVLLQSLDNDQEPSNGIKLTEESKSLSTTGLDLNDIPSNFSSNNSPLIALITAAKVSKNGVATSTPVSLQSARDHFANLALANIVIDSQTLVGKTIVLDGSKSVDSSTASPNFQWTLTSTPEKSTAKLKIIASDRVSFAADIAGPYEVTLTVGSGTRAGTSKATVNVAADTFGDANLYIFGKGIGDTEANQTTIPLGCLTCAADQADSVCNSDGEHGSLTRRSIWNINGDYGRTTSPYSPWKMNTKNYQTPIVYDAKNIIVSLFSIDPDLMLMEQWDNLLQTMVRPDPASPQVAFLINLFNGANQPGTGPADARAALCNGMVSAIAKATSAAK